jgi:hypothetical protein
MCCRGMSGLCPHAMARRGGGGSHNCRHTHVAREVQIECVPLLGGGGLGHDISHEGGENWGLSTTGLRLGAMRHQP